VREVVCFYGFDATPINLIKKRKKQRLKIELVDVFVRELCKSAGAAATT
jgi:hypothetical protein